MTVLHQLPPLPGSVADKLRVLELATAADRAAWLADRADALRHEEYVASLRLFRRAVVFLRALPSGTEPTAADSAPPGTRQLSELFDIRNAIATERDPARRLVLEREEEAVVATAEYTGLDWRRRHDADLRAVFGLFAEGDIPPAGGRDG